MKGIFKVYNGKENRRCKMCLWPVCAWISDQYCFMCSLALVIQYDSKLKECVICKKLHEDDYCRRCEWASL